MNFAAVIFAIAAATTTPVEPQSEANAGLKAAFALYERLLYNEAAVELGSALASGTLDTGDRIAAHRLLGIVEAIRGDEAAARAAFTELLHLDPHATLRPTLSPKILNIFGRVKAEHRPPALDLAPGPVTAPKPLEPQDGNGSFLVWGGVIGGVAVVAAIVAGVLLANTCDASLGCEHMP